MAPGAPGEDGEAIIGGEAKAHTSSTTEAIMSRTSLGRSTTTPRKKGAISVLLKILLILKWKMARALEWPVTLWETTRQYYFQTCMSEHAFHSFLIVEREGCILLNENIPYLACIVGTYKS